MLVLLTNKCNEMCSHCMECAHPNGKDYDPELLTPLIRYLRVLSPKVIHISGGEFTLAKDWFKVISEIIKMCPHHLFSFGTNGWWIENEEVKSQIKELCKFEQVINIQVSTHKTYYPNYEFTKSHEKDYGKISSIITYVDNWQGEGNGSSNLHRLGRAKDLISENEVKGKPGCAPVLSRAKQCHMLGIYEYSSFLNYLESSGYTCKPCIDLTTGRILVGESNECMEFDNLHNYIDANLSLVKSNQGLAFDRMKTLKFCDKCKAKKNIESYILQYLDL